MKDANPIFSDYEVSNFIPGHGIYIFITHNLQVITNMRLQCQCLTAV